MSSIQYAFKPSACLSMSERESRFWLLTFGCHRNVEKAEKIVPKIGYSVDISTLISLSAIKNNLFRTIKQFEDEVYIKFSRRA